MVPAKIADRDGQELRLPSEPLFWLNRWVFSDAPHVTAPRIEQLVSFRGPSSFLTEVGRHRPALLGGRISLQESARADGAFASRPTSPTDPGFRPRQEQRRRVRRSATRSRATRSHHQPATRTDRCRSLSSRSLDRRYLGQRGGDVEDVARHQRRRLEIRDADRRDVVGDLEVRIVFTQLVQIESTVDLDSARSRRSRTHLGWG